VTRGRCTRRCWRDKVVRSTLYVSATFEYSNFSSESRLSIYASASSIAGMVVELYGVEDKCKMAGVGRCAHGHCIQEILSWLAEIAYYRSPYLRASSLKYYDLRNC
jgi:hypothetical protein